MKFSKTLLATLKNFSLINNGIYLRPGSLINTAAASTAIYAEVNLPEEVIDFDVAIYDLNAFLSIVKLSGEESEIFVRGPNIIIKGPRSEISWPTCEPDSIAYPKKQMVFPPANVEFELNSETFDQCMKIARGVGASHIAIAESDGKIVVNSFNKDLDPNFSKPLATFDVEEYSGAGFNFIIDIRNMMVQSDNYRVKLLARGKSFAIQFAGDIASYIIAVEAISEHSFE